MFDQLRILFAEQTTPDEVVIFLLICVVLALIVAFGLYALVLALLWHGRLREVTGLRALLLPGPDQLRTYLGEYSLAAATSVLLTLTVIARHDAVQTVLDYSLEIDAAEAGQVASMADGAAVGLSVAVESLLRPTLEAGRAEHANLLMNTLVGEIGPDRWQRFPTRYHLLFLAVFLLTAYVLWFAWSRTRAVERDGGPGDTEYGEIIGRLLVPAVCVALLLVSAAGASDPQRLARSAVAVAALRALDAPGGDATAEPRSLAEVLTRQALSDSMPGMLTDIARLEAGLGTLAAEAAELRDTTRGLSAADAQSRRETLALLEELRGVMERDRALALEEQAALAARIDAAQASLLQLGERVDGLGTRAQEAHARALAADSLARGAARSVGALDGEVETLAVALRRVEQGMQGLAGRIPNTGLLLVVSSQGSYAVQGVGPVSSVRVAGTGVGLHALPPGTYRVTSGSASETPRIAPGEAETVRLLQDRAPVGPAPGEVALERPVARDTLR